MEKVNFVMVFEMNDDSEVKIYKSDKFLIDESDYCDMLMNESVNGSRFIEYGNIDNEYNGLIIDDYERKKFDEKWCEFRNMLDEFSDGNIFVCKSWSGDGEWKMIVLVVSIIN
jgi:hypothetical protein